MHPTNNQHGGGAMARRKGFWLRVLSEPGLSTDTSWGLSLPISKEGQELIPSVSA